MRPVGPMGPTDAKIMIVGEAPGAVEEATGLPFQGPAGQLLRGMMLASGIDPDKVFYTNLCQWRPPANELSHWFAPNGLPAEQKLIDGLYALKEQIETVRPNVIVPVGNFPLKLLTGKGSWNKKTRSYTGIGNYRGSILETTQITPGIKAIPTYHPAAVLRNYPSNAIVRLDLQRIREQSEFPEIRRLEKRIVIHPEGHDRLEWRDRLLNHGAWLTFDIEFISSKLLCCGFTSDRDEACVILAKSATDIEFMRELLLSGKPLNAQNGIFDCAILEWYYHIRCLPNLKHDTMVAAYNLYMEWPKDQGFLTSIYTEQPYYKDMVDWDAIKAGRQSLSTVFDYNAIDTWTEHQVMEEQRKELAEDPLIQQSFEFDMSKLQPLWEMSKRGMPVNVSKLEAIRTKALQQSATLHNEIVALAGREVNVKSGPQVVKWLFEDLGCPIVRYTEKGAPATGDPILADTLLKCTNDTQRRAITLVRNERQQRDIISKFCEIEWDVDNRARCHYDPCKTVTGRLSSRKFFPTGKGTNLQNILRDDWAREVFEADEGKEFAYADLERAESLVVAKISGDPEMLRIHAPGVDAHIQTASFLFRKPVDQITEEERYLAKRVRHASNYTMGWKKLMMVINADAQDTGVSITAAEAKALVNGYKDLHPFLVQWWHKTEEFVKRHRYLVTLTGRKRTFFDRIDSTLPEIIAYVPQGTVGDTLNIGLVRCAQDPVLANMGFELLVQVHDAIGYQYEPMYRNEVHARVASLMEVPLVVPNTDERFAIPVEIKYGPSWGQLTKWKPEAAHV